MTASYPAAAVALPALRGTEGPPPPPPPPAAPGQPRPRGPAASRRASPPLPQAAQLLRLPLPAPMRLPLPLPVLCGGSRRLPGYSPRRAPPAPPPQPDAAPRPRWQPNPPRCSAPRELLKAPASTCARLRSAARASSASPLLAAPGLIFWRSLAPVLGLLPPRQLVFCTALSPFPAISNLHALSFLRYRLILVWRRRFAIFSHAHSCG